MKDLEKQFLEHFGLKEDWDSISEISFSHKHVIDFARQVAKAKLEEAAERVWDNCPEHREGVCEIITNTPLD